MKKIYGYHHTLSSKEFLPWHSLHSEWNSKFKPDFVVSLGSVSKKMLTNQGIPSEKIIDGPALRYNNALVKELNNSTKNKNIVFILGEYCVRKSYQYYV